MLFRKSLLGGHLDSFPASGEMAECGMARYALHIGSGGRDPGELCEVRLQALCQHGGSIPQAFSEMAHASFISTCF